MDYKEEYAAIKLGELFAKEIQGQLSEEEAVLLRDMLDRSPIYRQAYESLQQEERQYLLKRIEQYDASAALASVLARAEQPAIKKRVRTLWYAAASVILLVSIATVTYFQLQEDPSRERTLVQNAADIPPGKNRAYITLADGRQITLDSGQNTVENKEGVLVYGNGEQVLTAAETTYATISTPVGGQYQITLPDGTKAWLNAASSLKYPTHFSENQRKVAVEGEVYFEVVSDKHKPFIVQSEGQYIEVLGTAFNIRNYGDHSITTLVHGKIALVNSFDHKVHILHPGDQARSDGTSITTSRVEATDFVAWKDGLIVNSDATLEETCYELERWYDVRFVFPKGFKNKEKAMNSLNKNEMLSSVLAALQHTYQVQFEISGKEVIVR